MLRLAALITLLLSTAAYAQPVTNPAPVAAAGAYNSTPPTCTNGQFCWLQTDAQGNLLISGSISTSIAGFEPAAVGTQIVADTDGDTRTAAAGAVLVVSNTSTTIPAFCNLGAAATAAAQPIQPGSWFAFTKGAATQITCITGSSTATLNQVGGSGIPTGAG